VTLRRLADVPQFEDIIARTQPRRLGRLHPRRRRVDRIVIERVRERRVRCTPEPEARSSLAGD